MKILSKTICLYYEAHTNIQYLSEKLLYLKPHTQKISMEAQFIFIYSGIRYLLNYSNPKFIVK